MHRNHHLRAWDAVHRWTSLICTVFLLLLCLTGLPLIIHDEIERATHRPIEPEVVAAETPAAPFDRIVATALARHPDKHPLFASHEPHEPRIWYVTLAPNSNGGALEQVAVDARTATIVGEPHVGQEGLMGILFSLHVDLFLGLKGKLFLGAMGVLFVASLVSGVVLYAPFLRKREFGAVEHRKGVRPRWLDLHNLLGIVTLTWAGVVGITGIINTCADLLLKHWQAGAISAPRGDGIAAGAAMQPYQTLLNRALEHTQGMEIAFLAFPATSFADATHLGIFVRGDTPLTARLVRPILVDTHAGTVSSDRGMPWYLTALLVSEPLHFGDYGGLPLKVLWAALDVLTLTVLASGVYLRGSSSRRRQHVAIRGGAAAG